MLARISLDVVAAVVTILVATFLIYALTVRLPGDPALALFRARYGDTAPPNAEQLQEISREAGFDDPLPVQYANWLGRALQGDMGTSYTSGRSVSGELMARIPVTAMLAFGSLAVAFVISVPLAMIATRAKAFHTAILGITQFSVSVPDFLLALVLVVVFGVWLSLAPVAGWGGLRYAILPGIVLAAYPCALFTRLLAAGIDEHRRADWARTGRAKGLTENRLLLRHVLPHALLPVISLGGIQCARALSSALVVEVIFAIPGSGRLLFDAIMARNIPMVQAALIVQVTLAIVASKGADLAALLVDPTLRKTSGRGR